MIRRSFCRVLVYAHNLRRADLRQEEASFLSGRLRFRVSRFLGRGLMRDDTERSGIRASPFQLTKESIKRWGKEYLFGIKEGIRHFRQFGVLQNYKTLHGNDGAGNFVDITPQMGIAEPTCAFLTWGTQFFDYDNDGWKDLMFVSGHDLSASEPTQLGNFVRREVAVFS